MGTPMDRHLLDVLRHLVEHDDAPVLVSGADAERRTDWARAIFEERSELDRAVLLESDSDWERAADDDIDAVIVPSLEAVDDERQATLLEWIADGIRVVAAGAADPDEAVRQNEIRVDLFYRLSLTPLPLGEFEATRQRPPGEVLAEALADASETEAGSERAVPSEWLADWCARAELQPTRAWRHSHLEDGELWTMEFESAPVTRAWRRLSETSGDLAYSPVVTPGRESVDTLLRDQHFEHDVVSPETADWRLEDWLRAASGVDVDRWVRRAVEREKAEGLGESYFDPDEPIEPVDRDDEGSYLVERAAGTAAVTLVPVADGPSVPAFFHYGGFNANPSAERHVAMLRHWLDRWDATLFGLSPEILELYVDDPITDADDAVAAAREQFAYCPSAPGQNIAVPARQILRAHWWTCWWD